VDEKTFNSKVQSLRAKRDEIRAYFNLNDENFVLFWPARLHEPTKGLVSFLEKVRDLIPSYLQLLFAGARPDRKLISRFVKNADLDSSVILLGQKTQDEMVELYSISDAFMLPSLKDPNPLSVIEALWSGLPIFISIGCGNHPEAVEERVNGWVISHEDTDALRIAFTEMIGQTKREREVFGSKSFKLANERFATNVCIERFIDEITCLK
jgi:glycosyltransferase involved in cell wall biosynthesis